MINEPRPVTVASQRSPFETITPVNNAAVRFDGEYTAEGFFIFSASKTPVLFESRDHNITVEIVTIIYWRERNRFFSYNCGND